MNILKRILQAINDNAQALHDFHCGIAGPDQRIICNHCGQHVNDPNINHANTGCTVKVLKD